MFLWFFIFKKIYLPDKKTKMIQEIIKWFTSNYIEASASILGVFSIYFGIKEKSFFWILATLNAILFVYVYYNAKMYALMSLQFYYITISIYGFYYWLKGGKKENQKKVPITKIGIKKAIIAFILFIIIYILLSISLKKFTNSPIPFLDSLVSTGSMFAAFFMMKKYVETWYIWIITDIITIGTLYSRHLYGATFLQTIYWIFAIIGYFQWKKSMKMQENNNVQI